MLFSKVYLRQIEQKNFNMNKIILALLVVVATCNALPKERLRDDADRTPYYPPPNPYRDDFIRTPDYYGEMVETTRDDEARDELRTNRLEREEIPRDEIRTSRLVQLYKAAQGLQKQLSFFVSCLYDLNCSP